MRSRLALSLLVTGLGLAGAAEARIISWGNVTNRTSVPAHQKRTNRRFVLVESRNPYSSPVGGGLDWPPGRLVVYDTAGAEEPREVFPSGAVEAHFGNVSAHEGEDGELRILAASNGELAPGENPKRTWRVLLSVDSGRTFRTVELPQGFSPFVQSDVATLPEDRGGPFCRGRERWTGTDDTPFLVLLRSSGGWPPYGLVSVGADGSARLLARIHRNGSWWGVLVGGDATGTRFVVSGSVENPASPAAGLPPNGLYRVGLDGSFAKLLDFGMELPEMTGWITPDGGVYVEVDWVDRGRPEAPFTQPTALYVVRDGSVSLVAASPLSSYSPDRGRNLFAIPTSDYAGAWVIQRAPGGPTVLSRHEPATGLVEQWRDVASPEIEALHAGRSGRSLLIQVRRQRRRLRRSLLSPAFALWEVGQPAPARYHDLALVEEDRNGFVHVDVDALASGAPFWFDSGLPKSPGGAPAGPNGVATKECCIARGSLTQALVLAATAHSSGMNGAFWKTDVLLRNESAGSVGVTVRFAPASAGGAPEERHLTLDPGELRVVPDALATLFGVESGHGALFLTPEPGRSISATSRTYTTSAAGSYGMEVAAVDVFSTTAPRAPVTFSAGLLGPGFRTNVGIVDPAGRGTEARLLAASESGWLGRDDVTIATAGGVPAQLDDVAWHLGLDASRTGSLTLAPLSGEAVPYLVAIDERTNDPAAFAPGFADAGGPVDGFFLRALPAIVHAGGANGAEWRTDLFFHNFAEVPRQVWLGAKLWDRTEFEASVYVVLMPHETRVIRDVLLSTFGKTGVARLRFWDMGGALGVRVTSRTYSERPGGGTYGVALPTPNAFRIAGDGEALEILLLAGPGTRTNLALVEMSDPGEGTCRVKVEVIGPAGLALYSFDVDVPVAGGIQVDDLLRGRGLPPDLPAALIRISPSAGSFSAYATVIDAGTNDPSYFAAGLASSW